ncbi:hypothetical protein ACLOJK_015163 [Asimina triloba]
MYSSVSSHEQDLKHLSWVTLAVGVEASISDPKENELVLKNVEFVVESQDEEKIQFQLSSKSSLFLSDVGVEASISDPKENELVLKNVEFVVESQDEEKIQVSA